MLNLKTTTRAFAIHTYRHLTGPIRAFRARQSRRDATVPVYSLFYHRVSNHTMNDWTISINQFEKQISWLAGNFDLVSMSEAQHRIHSGLNVRPTLTLTFDDGYADNSQHALPLLIKRRIPFTYFVCLGNILSGETFAHDAARGKPLAPHDPESIRLLASSPLVEIGAHTRTHADIGALQDPAKIFDEVITSSRELEQIIQRRIRYFAFPFGKHENLSVAAFHLLKQQGFDGVCSAYGGLNEVGGDAFHIQRLHGDPVFARVQNWLTGDPRVARKPGFQYQTDEQTRHELLKPFAGLGNGERPAPLHGSLSCCDNVHQSDLAANQ